MGSLQPSTNSDRSYWIPGSSASTELEDHHSFFKAIEKEGIKEMGGDKSRVGRPRQSHDPGIQQEPETIVPHSPALELSVVYGYRTPHLTSIRITRTVRIHDLVLVRTLVL